MMFLIFIFRFLAKEQKKAQDLELHGGSTANLYTINADSDPHYPCGSLN